ncbi:hypothetical protein [Planomonospora parontospora]|uniref:hypothetical protein n=1 Tax=Planomonospora parontospora TaxID=58119 RepID=UPI00167047D4|nr:hypothetical protein [Planomonospora parontospora]GGL56153.1 hypothetical protein GCM10014719_66890 [Planomonospora parontospora subsp. antibiotica]GII19156.1 hypothetical protein Ppa05_58820 [Planomonospora parontospora subsp. antibiotica]
MLRDPNICDACARLRLRRNREAVTSLDLWIPHCEAFPGRVPDEIFLGGFDHRAAYPGDGGVRFALREGAQDDLRLYEERIGAV